MFGCSWSYLRSGVGTCRGTGVFGGSAAGVPGTGRRVVLVGLLALVVGFSALAAEAGANLSDVHVSSIRDVCHLPRPGNNGKVVGQDGGLSVRLNGTTYFLFSDTYIDTNDDGGLSPGEDAMIQTGTIAKTTDLNAADCVDLTYKMDGEFAAPLLDPVPGEDCAWPSGTVVANDEIYFYYHSAWEGHCVLGDFQADVGLAKLVGDPENMDASRVVPTLWKWGEPSFVQALAVTDEQGDKWIYVFAQDDDEVRVARVPEGSIESPSAYRYWTGSSHISPAWVPDVDRAGPIFLDYRNGISNTPSISFNRELDKFLAIYSCGFAGTRMCARTTRQTGDLAESLASPAWLGNWMMPRLIHDCPGDWQACYQPFYHADYGDGDTIYVTAARNSNPPMKRYWLMLRELKLSTSEPPPDRQFINAASEYSGTQLENDWVYLTWRHASSSYEWGLDWHSGWKAWVGRSEDPCTGSFTTSLGTFPTPFLHEDGGWPRHDWGNPPDDRCDAVRAWVAPTGGSLRISGEAWHQFECGPGVKVKIALIRNNQPASLLWWRYLESGRGETFDFTLTVNQGDTIAFHIGDGGFAYCYNTYFNPTMVFDPGGAVLANEAPAASFTQSSGPLTLEPVTFTSTGAVL
ncbi:hypothetical protein LCGC14_1989230 [marine sediment metagenome]|uniref:Uncharacterized protein n=1 Tax=marine sediment metagenome TaxID=412755 RepID=A0A0F9FUM6_9ZZZZ